MADSHPFDAIVQAANPSHPDHSAWVERFGSSSRTRRPSNAGSTHKSDNFLDLRAEAEHGETEGAARYADAVAHDDEGPARGSRSPGGSRRPSVHSAAGSATPKRKKRKDKGKGRAPAPPIPPPRTTSVLGVVANPSPQMPSPPGPAAPSESFVHASGLPSPGRADTTLDSEVTQSLARSGARTPSESQSTSSKHRKKKKSPLLPKDPPEFAPRKSSFSVERDPHQIAYTSTRGWQDLPPLPPQALGIVQAHPGQADRSPTAPTGPSRISFDVPSGSARPGSPSTKAVSFTEPQSRDGGSSVRRSLDSVFAPFGVGKARKAREEEAARQIIERMSANRTADGRPASILTNGSSSRQSIDSAGPGSSMRGMVIAASDSSMHGHGSLSSPTSAMGLSASPGASPLTRPQRRMGGMHLMPVGPSASTGGRPLSSVHDVRESGTEGEDNFVDARSEDEGGLGSDDEETKHQKASQAKAQSLRKRSSASSSVAGRRQSLENGHAAARAARQAALEREAHDLPPFPTGAPASAPGREVVFPLLKHDSDSSAEEEAVDLKGTPIGAAGSTFGSPANGSMRRRSGSRVSARESLRSQHASPSIDSLPHPPRASTSMGTYEVRKKTSTGLRSNTSSSNLSFTASSVAGGATTEDRRERFQKNQYYIPPSFSQPSLPPRSMARSGLATTMATAQSESSFLPQTAVLDQHTRSTSQPGFGAYAANSPAPPPQQQFGTPSLASQQQQRFPSRPEAPEAGQAAPLADNRPAPPSKSPSSRSIASFFSRSKPVPPPPFPAAQQPHPQFPAGGEPMVPLASGSTGSTLHTTSDAHLPSSSTSPQQTLVDHSADMYAMGQARKDGASIPSPRAAIGLGIGSAASTPSMDNLDYMPGGRAQESPVVKPTKVNGSAGGWRQRVASFSKSSPKGQQLARQQAASQQVPDLPTPNETQWRRDVLTEAVGLSLTNSRRGNEVQPQMPPSPAMDRSNGSIEGNGTSSRPSLDLQRLLGRGGRSKEPQSSAGDSLGVASGATIHKSLSPAMLDSWTHEADEIDSVIGSVGEEMEELDVASPARGPEPGLTRADGAGANGDAIDSEQGRFSTEAKTTLDTRTDGMSTPERGGINGGQRSMTSSMDHDLPDPPIKVRLMRPSVEVSGNSSDAPQTLIGHQRASSVGGGAPGPVAAPPIVTGSFAEKMKGKKSAPPAALSLDSSTSAVASLKAATSSTSDLHEQRGRMYRVDSPSLTRPEEEPRSAGLSSSRSGFAAALGGWRPKQRSDSTSTRASAFTNGTGGGPGGGSFMAGSPMMSPSFSAPGSDFGGAISHGGGGNSSGLRSPGFLSALRKAAGGGKRKGGTPGSGSGPTSAGFSSTGGISSADFAFEEQEFMSVDDDDSNRFGAVVQPLGNGFTGGPAAYGKDSLEAARAATDLLAVQSETMPLTPSSFGGYGSSAPATPALSASRPRMGSSSANQRPTAWYQAEGGAGAAYVMNGSEPWPGQGGAAVSSSDDLPSISAYRDGRPRTMSSSQAGSSYAGIGATAGARAAASSASLTASVSAPGGPASPSVRSPDLTMFGQMLARAQAEDAARIKGIAAKAVAGGGSGSPAPHQTRQGTATAAR